MKLPLVLSLCLVLAAFAGDIAAQTTREEARAAGKALAQERRGDATLLPDDESHASVVPGYMATPPPPATYFADPDGLAAAAAAQAAANEPYRIVTDPGHVRPRFSAEDLRRTTARASAIEADPNPFLAGEEMTVSAGACTPLPAGTGAAGFYEATCTTGARVEETAPTCRVPLAVQVQAGPDRYGYICEDRFDRFRHNGQRLCTPFDPAVAQGVCRETEREIVGWECLLGRPSNCVETGEPIYAVTLACDAPVTARAYSLVPGAITVTEHRDEAMCAAATANSSCTLTAETCVDSEPATRSIGGSAVTRACWAWQRRYSCRRVGEGSDCGELERGGRCAYLRDECLDDPPDGRCRVTQQVYRCPLPGDAAPSPTQFVCGSDVYCLNGDCEPIQREASTEFKDALVALHAIDDASSGFDPARLTVFSGERSTCHHKLFGLSNCCSGRGVPLLTPWLCDASERTLDRRDDLGLCHRVGSYCADQVLGICVTRRDAYCCFGSRLARILQEQGRDQLGRRWGSPKSERCAGFTIDEFARLDLSRMNFAEVYAEFVDAARLPDEVRAIDDIQTSIRSYYDLHRG